MKLFYIMIAFLYFTMGLDMDMFVVGQHNTVMGSGGPEMLPILESSEYLYIHFYLNMTASVLNCSCHHHHHHKK